jgi:hypothetical protein
MRTIKEVFGKIKVINYGFTTARLKGHKLSISHAGNMGNSILDTSKNLQAMGLPSITELKDTYFLEDEFGSPDYMYTITFDIGRDVEVPYKTATILLTEPKEGKWDNQYLKIPFNDKDGKVIGWNVEKNPDFKTGIYIEDGMLEETNLLEFFELDMEGKYTIGPLGIFKVKPEYFEVRIEKTWDGLKHFYDYRLNNEGWKYLEENGLKHPGRGYVRYELITKSDLSKKRNNMVNTIQKLSMEQAKLDGLF